MVGEEEGDWGHNVRAGDFVLLDRAKPEDWVEFWEDVGYRGAEG